MVAREKRPKAAGEKIQTSKVETWLYHKEKGGKIHLLTPGAAFPKGWRDTPWPQEKAPKEEGN